MNEGVIKFNCPTEGWIKIGPFSKLQIQGLNNWRKKMFDLKLIGAYADGIGYGNISQRLAGSEFIISGTQTGQLPVLDGSFYTIVAGYSLSQNCITTYKGLTSIKPSAECMTHGAIYEKDPQITGIIHVHNLKMWETFIDKLPTTSKNVEYGTPAMALEMQRLLKKQRTKDFGIIVMGGHKEGLVSFGKTLDEAGEIMLKYYSQANNLSAKV
jgi:L-ribulose-5-phosphate 4-epimerase